MAAMTKEQVQEQYNKQNELEQLLRVFHKLDAKQDGKIDVPELYAYVRYLGYRPKKNEVDDMIWEVDENGDGVIDWEEFQLMFQRARDDKKSGWEPKRLYTMVEFMMVDKDGSGTIDVDECMEILYRQFGKHGLEEKVLQFMSQHVKAAGGANTGDNTISFDDYLEGLRKTDDKVHPGFAISQGMVATTLEENRRLLAEMAYKPPLKPQQQKSRPASPTNRTNRCTPSR